MITRDSRISDLLKNPIGCDVLSRLVQYAGVDIGMIGNPLIRSVKLKALPKLAGKVLDDRLLDSMICLFNQDDGVPMPEPSDGHAWWKEAVVYQIYPRSFKDGNGDGVGDIPGILEKIDYLHALGVDALWLCPVYDSPNDDNGYDIRDYEKIMSEFGTMEDMENLIAALHERGMRLIMDMVLNHTSDEHRWFQASLHDPDGPYGDYYIWRKTSDGNPPNNWRSFFSGSAWTYYPERDAWAMHLFSSKQMDLNWENPAVREEIYNIMRFWREKGVDGFRLDVINLISKTTLDDGNETLGAVLGFTGFEHYFYGKDLHARLRDFRTYGLKDAFAVGEMSGTGPEMNKLLTAPSRGELDMAFCFDHLDCPGKNRFDDYRYDLNHLKKCFLEYEGSYADVTWPSIFTENHDNPRMVSKIDPELRFRTEISKLLAVAMLTARGTPFLYQGQELGMANVPFADVSELRDVESLNRFRELSERGDADAWPHILAGTRDHARTPMQWENAENGGFSGAQPWIRTGDPAACSVQAEENEPESPLNFFRSMIALRKAYRDALVYGTFEPVAPKKKDLFCYYRRGGNATFYVEMNLSDHEVEPPELPETMTRVLSNYPDATTVLRPYEASVYRI